MCSRCGGSYGSGCSCAVTVEVVCFLGSIFIVTDYSIGTPEEDEEEMAVDSAEEELEKDRLLLTPCRQ